MKKLALLIVLSVVACKSGKKQETRVAKRSIVQPSHFPAVKGRYVVSMTESFAKPLISDEMKSDKDRVRQSELNAAQRKVKIELVKSYCTKNEIQVYDSLIFVNVGIGFVATLDSTKAESVNSDSINVENVTPDFEINLGDPIQQRDPIQQSDPIRPEWDFADPVLHITAAVAQAGGPIDGSTKSTAIWIIDTGIQPDHPDLNVETNPLYARSLIPGVITPNDDNGHGTHVAGIAAAKQNGFGCTGVSAGARVIPVKILDTQGRGTWSALSLALDLVGWYGQSGDVINLSLGRYCVTNCENFLPDLRNKIRSLARFGIYVVMSAGNDAGDASLNLPGCINDVGPSPKVYTVVAMERSTMCAFYSNFGMAPADYIAVGTNVYSTYLNSQYKIMSGTSMSAAVVSGVVHARGGAPTSIATVTCGSPAQVYPIASR